MAGQEIAAFAAFAGRDAANFMQALKAPIENPLTLLAARRRAVASNKRLQSRCGYCRWCQ